MNSDLLFKAESYKIIGACFEVYREKGCGFLEPRLRAGMFIRKNEDQAPTPPPRTRAGTARTLPPALAVNTAALRHISARRW